MPCFERFRSMCTKACNLNKSNTRPSNFHVSNGAKSHKVSQTTPATQINTCMNYLKKALQLPKQLLAKEKYKKQTLYIAL